MLHESPGSRFSLIPGDFPSNGMKEERVKPGELKIFGIKKEIRDLKVHRNSQQCIDYEIQNSQSKCYMENILAKRFQNESMISACKNVSKACLIPQAKNFIDFNLDQCTTKEEYDCMKGLLITNENIMAKMCPKPCKEISFKTVSKSLPHDITNYAIVIMHYMSNDYVLLEEYLVFDFTAILVALGGSLGLFLGFSCLQCFNSIVDRIIEMF